VSTEVDPTVASRRLTPFVASLADDVFYDLRRRLRATRWPEVPTGTGWSASVDADWLRVICDYWATDYDWRRDEARLKKFEELILWVDGEQAPFPAMPLIAFRRTPGCLCMGGRVVPRRRRTPSGAS
jgi:hypothetical protein